MVCEHGGQTPTQSVAKELLAHRSSPSKMRSGKGWSWPREGEQGGGGGELAPEICKDQEVMAYSGTLGRAYFAKGGVNPLPNFVWLRV